MSKEEKQKLLSDEDDDDGYGVNDKKKSKKSKSDNDTTSIRDLFRYADWRDAVLLVVGVSVSLVTGAGWPAMSMIFGGLSNTFISAQSTVNSGNFDQEMVTDIIKNMSPGVMPQITKDMFTSQVSTYCLQYTYLGIAILICGYIQMVCWITACERQINKIRRGFFYGILRQDIAWFDRNASGTLTAKLSDNLERIKEGIGDKFGLLIQYTAQCIAGVIIAMAYSWKATLVMMSLSPLIVVSSAFMGRRIATSVRRETEKYAVAGAIAEEVLSCIRTVIAFNGQSQECDRYQAALEKGKQDGIMKNVWTGVGLSAMFLTMFCSYGLAFWYGSVLIVQNEIERGDVFVVFFSVMMGSMALGNAGPQMATLATAKGAGKAIFDIIDRKPEIDSYSLEGAKPDQPKGRIEFSDVYFNYPTRKEVPVLSGINFAVQPGETVALVGPSGCGKSTAVQLLLRFYDPDSGRISIDGTALTDLNINWLRNLIGVVSQEPVLFECSVEENIRFGRKNITTQEMIRACRMANAHDFISKMPDGYGTMVGERGTAMSGGQKQRIAIARALVRDPKILLLDEATSALDAESESIVQQALDKAQEGRTTIVIAHRLSTIRNASKIIAIDAGRIKEMGTHAELMDHKGLYYDLVTTQVFHDAGSDYVSGEDEEKPESEDSGADLDPGKARRASRRLTKSSSQQRSRGDSIASELSDTSSAATKRRRMSRMLSHVDTEQDRLKRELEEEGGQKSNFARILSECRQEWCYIILALIGAAGRGFILPAFSFFYSEIFNVYSKSGQEMVDGTRFWSIMFVVLGVLNMVFTMMSVYFIGLSGENITMRLRMGVFRNVLRQDVGYFDSPTHSTGRICTRLATDAPNVKAALDFRFAMVLTAFISMVAGCGLAFYFGWQMAFVVLAIFPFFAIGSYLRMKLRTDSAKRDNELLEEAGKVATEGIENVRTVQALTREQTFYENFCTHLVLPYKEGIRQAHIQAISFAFAQSVFFFMYAICFRFGAFMVDRDKMTPIDVYRVFFAINFSGMMVGMATAYFPEYIKARFSAGLVFKMTNEEPGIDSCSRAGLKPEISGALLFNDVHFTYPARVEAPVLQGLTLDLNPGQTLALVGPSGCGKSTVVSLLERFYDPLSGAVKADGFDLRTINVPYMRGHIALVSQEPVLFDCSIEDNITYGLRDITHEKVVDAAKRANIHNFIAGLPLGYETSVGEKGTQLSGGQKQRVAIARALVRDPKILLLDEATSALDTESEKIVQEAIDRAREGRTCIIIAHRLSTIQSADSIAVIKNGKVVEQGKHGELVSKRGDYYNLTKKQNLVA